MRFVTPTVRLIARTEIEDNNIAAWMMQLGCDDDVVDKYAGGDNKTEGERLVELAGRRCYLSFEPGLNPNVNKIRTDIVAYINNVLDSGHGCYDIETDVLTANGWKSWPDVTSNDKLATRTVNGVIEYHKPTRLIQYNHTGKMYRTEAQQVDLLVTPDHKHLVCKTTTKQGRKKEDFEFEVIPCTELNTVSHAYVKTGIWDSAKQLPSGVAKLLGFSIGDGCLAKERVEFHLKRPRKILWLKQLCNEYKFDLHELLHDTYSVKIPDGCTDLFYQIYTNDRQKQIPPGILLFSRITLESLLEGLIQSDGSVSDTGTVYDTTSELLAGQFQQLALHVGFAAQISQAECYKNREQGHFGDKPLFRLTLIERNLKPEVNKYAGGDGKTYWVDGYEGDVFCAEVPNNTLYVRRNGKTVWSGNSVLEHYWLTFSIENVSRVFTGEMNRHRAGTAISEGSMRYIRFNDIPIVMPPCIDGPDDDKLLSSYSGIMKTVTEIKEGFKVSLETKKLLTRWVFKNVAETVEYWYEILLTIWGAELAADSKFSLKKQITSMIRRIVPMGVATGGVWSFNLRSLRHICELRTTPAAEEEIALVVGKMLEIMMQEEPTLFGDFNKMTDGYWVPKYHKV